MLKGYGEAFLDNYSFPMAVDAFNKILEVDEGNYEIRWKKFLAELQVCNEASLKWATYRFDDETIEKFKNEVLAYVPESSSTKKSSPKKSKETTTAAEIMKDYNPVLTRANFINAMITAIQDAVPYTRKPKILSKIFLYYAADFSANASERTVLHEAISNIDEKGNVAFKTNAGDYNSQSIEYKKFSQKTGNLKNVKDIKNKILMLQKSSVSENGENSKMFETASIQDLLKAFDKIISFYSVADESKMNDRICELAGILKDNDYFDEAIKYYNIIVSANKKAYYAYWAILQCKLKCKTDEDLIYQKTPLKTIPEFQDAINSADDETIISRYTNVYNEQRNPNKAKKKPINSSTYVNPTAQQKNGKSFEKAKKRNVVIRVIFIVFAAIMALSILGGKLYQKKYKEDIMFGAKAVTSVEDLKNMVYSKKYYLANDIDLADANWLDFGKDFGGTLFGNGHKIANFKVPYHNGDKTYVGLFGNCDGATFKNLVLENFDINFENQDKNNPSNATYLGGLLAYGKNCTIDDVKISGNIYGNYILICGSVAGILYDSTITNAVSTCNIYARRYTGGIVGSCSNVTADNLTNNAEFVKTNSSLNDVTRLGGIFGYFSGKATNLVNNAQVYHESVYYNVGGIVGSLSGTIENCTNNGNVTGGARVGGIAGYMDENAKLQYATNNGNVTATSKVKKAYTDLGGIYGYSYKSTISDLKNYGKIITLSGTGRYIGGIGGDTWSQDHPVYNNMHNYGEFVIDDDSTYDVGGIFGHIYSDNGCCFTLQNSSNNVSISAKTSNVGGAIGYAQGYKSGGTYTKEVWYGGCQIYNFKQVGDVTGENYVGGVVGFAQIGIFDLKNIEFTGTASRFDGKTDNVGENCGYYYSGQ